MGLALEVDDLAASVTVVGNIECDKERTSLKNAIKILQECTEIQKQNTALCGLTTLAEEKKFERGCGKRPSLCHPRASMSTGQWSLARLGLCKHQPITL